jgi:hypothetical protein
MICTESRMPRSSPVAEPAPARRLAGIGSRQPPNRRRRPPARRLRLLPEGWRRRSIRRARPGSWAWPNVPAPTTRGSRRTRRRRDHLPGRVAGPGRCPPPGSEPAAQWQHLRGVQLAQPGRPVPCRPILCSRHAGQPAQRAPGPAAVKWRRSQRPLWRHAESVAATGGVPAADAKGWLAGAARVASVPADP